MRNGLSESLIGIVIAGGLFQFYDFGSAFAQAAKPGGKAGIVSALAWASVTVEIEIHASDKQLVIPYCVEDGTKANLLYCNQGLEYSFEYLDGGKWIRTKPGYPGEVFGVDTGVWKPAIIPPGGSTTFKYRFNPDLFHLRKGEKLRLIIDAWESPESLAENGKPTSRFVSPVFVCP